MSTPKLFQFKNITVDLNFVFAISALVVRQVNKKDVYYASLSVKHADAQYDGLFGDDAFSAHKDYERLLERWASDK